MIKGEICVVESEDTSDDLQGVIDILISVLLVRENLRPARFLVRIGHLALVNADHSDGKTTDLHLDLLLGDHGDGGEQHPGRNRHVRYGLPNVCLGTSQRNPRNTPVKCKCTSRTKGQTNGPKLFL